MANKRLTSDTWSFFCENIARGKRHIDYEIDFQAYKCNLHGKKVKKKKKKKQARVGLVVGIFEHLHD